MIDIEKSEFKVGCDVKVLTTPSINTLFAVGDTGRVAMVGNTGCMVNFGVRNQRRYGGTGKHFIWFKHIEQIQQ